MSKEDKHAHDKFRKDALKAIKEGDVVVALLMTSEVLADGHAMSEAVAAVKAGKLLVPVMVAGYGYNYDLARPMISARGGAPARRWGDACPRSLLRPRRSA